MIFRDNITLIAPVDGVYRQTGGDRHNVKCIVEQTSGLTRGGSYDAMTGDARAYLDGRDSWLSSTGYSIEGYFAEVTLFGVKRVYRVANVAVGRAVITSGKVQHVEIELARLDREV